jgi:hypothetical protein
MPLKEPFVWLECLLTYDTFAFPLEDFVEEQHRRAMRDGGEDLVEGHGQSSKFKVQS